VKVALLSAGALVFAGTAGFFASSALSGSSAAPVRTVTVTLRNGATGPAGPRGATGPAGATSCPSGFEPGVLEINHPGGQVRVFTCLEAKP
jgi:hypothetical protein